MTTKREDIRINKKRRWFQDEPSSLWTAAWLYEKNEKAEAFPMEETGRVALSLTHWRIHAGDILGSGREARFYVSDTKIERSWVIFPAWHRLTTGQTELEHTFHNLVEKWRNETALLSITEKKAMHSAYQRIIGMGPAVIPLILRELKERGGHWFWALKAITGEDPVKPEDIGNIRKMAEAWIKWGKEQGYL